MENVPMWFRSEIPLFKQTFLFLFDILSAALLAGFCSHLFFAKNQKSQLMLGFAQGLQLKCASVWDSVWDSLCAVTWQRLRDGMIFEYANLPLHDLQVNQLFVGFPWVLIGL